MKKARKQPAKPAKAKPVPRKKALIIGIGSRIEQGFLPALHCLADRFEVAGVLSPETGLGGTDLAALDLAILSMPTPELGPVLESLLPHAGRLRLLIDPPVAATPDEARVALDLLRQFAGVTIAEDFLTLPSFTLVRRAVAGGLIGEPSSLSLFNIGSGQHGLALIRAFVGFAPVSTSWRRALGTHGVILGYGFADGFSATVIGPARGPQGGGLLIEGTTGIITGASADVATLGAKRPVHVLGPLVTDGLLTGYRISGGERDLEIRIPMLAVLRDLDIADKSDATLLAICSLIEAVDATFDAESINAAYGYEEALYDFFATRRARLGLADLDPFALHPLAPPPTRWRSRVDTYMKVKDVMAATLGEAEKILARKGDLVVAEREGESVRGHVALHGVSLNGTKLPGDTWYIFSDGWERLRAGDQA